MSKSVKQLIVVVAAIAFFYSLFLGWAWYDEEKATSSPPDSSEQKESNVDLLDIQFEGVEFEFPVYDVRYVVSADGTKGFESFYYIPAGEGDDSTERYLL